jgi:hypothetical protein
VAVLRLHAASSRWPRNEGSIRLSEGNVCALEHEGSSELPRTPYIGSPQKSPSTHSAEQGYKKGAGALSRPDPFQKLLGYESRSLRSSFFSLVLPFL